MDQFETFQVMDCRATLCFGRMTNLKTMRAASDSSTIKTKMASNFTML